MKAYQLLVGDEHGLRDGHDGVLPKGYSGPTGDKALPDPDFVLEVINRRTMLKLSAVGLSEKSGYSRGYVSMLEKGSRHASEEAKDQIRRTLDRLERNEEEE